MRGIKSRFLPRSLISGKCARTFAFPSCCWGLCNKTQPQLLVVLQPLCLGKRRKRQLRERGIAGQERSGRLAPPLGRRGGEAEAGTGSSAYLEHGGGCGEEGTAG